MVPDVWKDRQPGDSLAKRPVTALRLLYLEESDEAFVNFVNDLRQYKLWEVVHARDAQEAHALASKQPVDVALLSATMPDTDPIQIAEELTQLHPKLTTFILAPDTESGGALAYASGRFQWLPKPVNATPLIAAVERMDSLVSWIKNKTTLSLVAGIHSLPPIPSNYNELLKIINSPDSALADIAESLTKDIGVTSRVLQVANSAYFGYSKKVTAPLEAVNLLGIARLKSIVLYSHMLNNFPLRPDAAADLEAVWRHSIDVGELARALALQATQNSALADEACTAGLLHDVGKLVLMALKGEEYKQILHQASAAHSPIHLTERIKLGSTHAEAGAYLLSLWGLPNSILEVVAWHHFPGETVRPEFSPLTAVHLADTIDHYRQKPDGVRFQWALDEPYLGRLNLPIKIEDWLEEGAVQRQLQESATASKRRAPAEPASPKESGTKWFTSFFSKNSRK